MRIGVQTWGSEGDLRPFFALAEGLAQAGHEVSLKYTSADDRDYSGRLERASFRHAKVGSLAMTKDELVALCARGFADRNPIRQLDETLRALLEPSIPDMVAAAQELTESSDLIVHHLAAHPAAAAAEKAGLPAVTVYPSPLFPMRRVPVPGAPDLGALNPWLWRVALAVVDRKLLRSVSAARAAMGLAAIRRARHQSDRSALDLLAVSPTLLPRSDEWPEKVKVCGFLDPPRSTRSSGLEGALESFLAEGPAPVFVTFGSMAEVDGDPEGVLDIVAEAVDRVGCRAILQTGPTLRPARREHPRIVRVGATPHDEVFPRCAVIVHHGGAGTTQAALRAGRPSVVVAHVMDQFFWGDRLTRLGVAPKHLQRRTLHPKTLGAAIATALGDPHMPAAAAALGERMQGEDGVASAVRWIETLAR
jgi:sterol 3beta-glucosyltransferase